MKELITPKGETKFIFFSGKGGVGKSTMSCATAVWLANQGFNTLLVTTDPAPNLSDIFGQEIGAKITKISSVDNLSAIEIDPDVATKEYQDRVVSPMIGILDEQIIKTTREQMDSPCVEEIAAFDKFIDFMDDPSYDVVVFDTAPTGHTIRLLQLPQGWSEEIGKGGATCIGPSDSLSGAKEKYDKAVSYLTNPEKTTFVFVMKPEQSSFLETKRSSDELALIGIATGIIIINGIYPNAACTIEFYKQKKNEQEIIIQQVEDSYKKPLIIQYPLRNSEINGSEKLLQVGRTIIEQEAVPEDTIVEDEIPASDISQDHARIQQALTPNDSTRYIFFTGKGGVGKSTVACTTGVWLSEQGHKTLVVTTDPASHLQNIFGKEIGYEPTQISDNLFAARVDQVQALKEYKERILNHVMEDFASNKSIKVDMDATRKKIEEELESPCAEEMAAFEKFMSYFELTGYDVIIIDTAPTGHTLRLLELPSMWKGFLDLGTLTKDTDQATKNKYARIINIMKDTNKSTFAFVMYPEYTPIMEAYRASEELNRQVGINTGLVAINYMIPAEHGTNNFLQKKINQQRKYVKDIQEKFKTPLLFVPILEQEPQGLEQLKILADTIF